MNNDGGILSHAEYQHNIADSKTIGPVLSRLKANTGKRLNVLTADLGFDQSYKKQRHCCRRWAVKRLAIPKKGKRPHEDSSI